MKPRRPPLLPIAAMLLTTLASGRAHAERYPAGYGRFQGDLDLSLAVGGELAQSGPAAALAARAFYLETAGLYATYADALGTSREARRSAALGVALRPLFLPRWASDLEHGPGWLDLTIDSF